MRELPATHCLRNPPGRHNPPMTDHQLTHPTGPVTAEQQVGVQRARQIVVSHGLQCRADAVWCDTHDNPHGARQWERAAVICEDAVNEIDRELGRGTELDA